MASEAVSVCPASSGAAATATAAVMFVEVAGARHPHSRHQHLAASSSTLSQIVSCRPLAACARGVLVSSSRSHRGRAAMLNSVRAQPNRLGGQAYHKGTNG